MVGGSTPSFVTSASICSRGILATNWDPVPIRIVIERGLRDREPEQRAQQSRAFGVSNSTETERGGSVRMGFRRYWGAPSMFAEPMGISPMIAGPMSVRSSMQGGS